ncbi:MAG: hypothetical protein H7X71_03010 [Chitinophagales bacterium]|nr:hypothetical protein [Chitinophagales bacterium]
MRKLYFITIISVSLFVYSCDNEDEIPDPPVGTYTPTIIFIEPADGEILDSGDELHMEVDFDYAGNTIHHVGLFVINEALNDTVFEFEEHADTPDFYSLHEHIVTDVAVATEYMVVAWSSNSDESIVVSEHVHVTVNP